MMEICSLSKAKLLEHLGFKGKSKWVYIEHKKELIEREDVFKYRQENWYKWDCEGNDFLIPAYTIEELHNYFPFLTEELNLDDFIMLIIKKIKKGEVEVRREIESYERD